MVRIIFLILSLVLSLSVACFSASFGIKWDLSVN